MANQRLKKLSAIITALYVYIAIHVRRMEQKVSKSFQPFIRAWIYDIHAAAWLKEWILPIAIIVLLLVLLPPYLTPFMGIFGTYTTYAVTGVVVAAALWLSKKAKKAVD